MCRVSRGMGHLEHELKHNLQVHIRVNLIFSMGAPMFNHGFWKSTKLYVWWDLDIDLNLDLDLELGLDLDLDLDLNLDNDLDREKYYNFNQFCYQKWLKFPIKMFLTLIHTHYLRHLDSPSHSSLDLFIVNHAESVIDFTKSESPFIAGHDFVELTLSINNPQPPSKTITTRNLRNINHTATY